MAYAGQCLFLKGPGRGRKYLIISTNTMDEKPTTGGIALTLCSLCVENVEVVASNKINIGSSV